MMWEKGDDNIGESGLCNRREGIREKVSDVNTDGVTEEQV